AHAAGGLLKRRVHLRERCSQVKVQIRKYVERQSQNGSAKARRSRDRGAKQIGGNTVVAAYAHKRVRKYVSGNSKWKDKQQRPGLAVTQTAAFGEPGER